MISVLPNTLDFIGLFGVSVLKFILIGKLLIFVNGVIEFFLNLLYFFEKKIVSFLEFQPFILGVNVLKFLGKTLELSCNEFVSFVKPFELLVNHNKPLFPNWI